MRIAFLLIYVTFLVGDFVTPGAWYVTMVKLLGLFLCFVQICHKSPHDQLLKIAMGFTILSDVILALNNVNEWGVVTFCFAHFFHMARLAGTAPKFFVSYLLFLLFAFGFGMVLGVRPMIAVGAIYGVSLLSNLWLSRRWLMKEPLNPQARCAFFGFLLFLACDLSVVVSYFALIGVLPLPIRPVADYMAWFFYFPAQVLIANSSKTLKTMIQ